MNDATKGEPLPGKVNVKLSAQPDGCGFFYGQARMGDAVCHINVLPPAPLWRGDFKLDDHPPDPTHWQVFADGELIAKVSRREDVDAAMVPLLTKREA